MARRLVFPREMACSVFPSMMNWPALPRFHEDAVRRQSFLESAGVIGGNAGKDLSGPPRVRHNRSPVYFGAGHACRKGRGSREKA